jgi:hypothetical protein
MTMEGTMKVQMAYCSACDRDVQIAFPTEPTVTDGQANIMDTEVLCLEIGRTCTGSLCPIGAQPPAVMAVRLIRSGVKPVMHRLQTALCEACGGIERFALIDATHATCTGCGRTVDRVSLATPTSH